MTLASKWSTVRLIKKKYNILLTSFYSLEMLRVGYYVDIEWVSRKGLSITKLR